MGTNSSAPTPTAAKLAFDPDEWKPIPLLPYTNTPDPLYSSNFTVLAHKTIQGLEAEKYELFFNSHAQYLSYLEHSYERKRFPHLVAPLHIEPTTKRGMCSTFHTAVVYLERIPIRLFQIIDMPLGEGLYMLEVALEAYQKMFEKTGYFEVSSDMMGINRQGKAKVWVNRNYSKNFPDFSKIDHNQGQEQFVSRVIEIIDEAIDYNGQRPTFLEFMSDKRKVINFQAAKTLLKLYMQNYGLVAQKLMKSILIVYKNQNTEKQQGVKSTQNITTLGAFRRSFFRKNSKTQQFEDTRREDTAPTTKRKSKKNMNSSNLTGSNLQSDLHYGNTPVSTSPQKLNHRAHKQFVNRNTIHMSFIKNEPKTFDIDEAAFMENFQTEVPLRSSSGQQPPGFPKGPPISFHYKSSFGGLYSPQNNSKTTSFPFELQMKKSESKGQNERKNSRRQIRKSISVSGTLEERKKYFNSNGDVHQIDPDIAQDLQKIYS